MALQILIGLHLNPGRVRSLPSRRPVSIAVMETLHHVHSGDHLPDGRDSLRASLPHSAQVEKQVRGASVRSRRGMPQRAFDILRRIVGKTVAALDQRT